MSVTSGFFNSQNHDRLYTAEQMSAIFDGIILDGILQGVGDAFKVSPYSDAVDTVIVGTGRAWFDHTWTLNDTQFSITLDPPGTLLKRIDAIVIDVNRENNVRSNSILYVKGIPSDSPQKPELVKTELHNQYPLVYIDRNPTTDSLPVSASDITNMIGSDECPLVTGLLESLDLDMFVQQMESKFNIWFDGLENVLEGDVVLNLQNQINHINEKLDEQSSNLIDAETLEKAKNTSISVAKPFTLACSARAFLPDGCVIDVGYGENGQVDSTQPKQIKISLVNSDGVVSQTVNGPTVYYPSKFICPCTWSIPSSYPCDLYFGVSGTDQTEKPSYNTLSSLIYHFIKVTVTSEHVISYSDITSTVPGLDINLAFNADEESVSPFVPVCLDDGSVITSSFFTSDTDVEKRPTYAVALNKLSSEGVASHGPLYNNDDDNIVFLSSNHVYLYMRKEENDYPDIALEGQYNGSLRFDKATLTMKERNTSSGYASNISQIKINNYMSKYKDASSINVYKNSLTVSETEAVPYSMEFNFTLNPPTSFGTPNRSTISPDKNVVLAATSSAMRVGVRPGNGVMAWSSPYTGSNANALSSASMINSMLFTPSSWWSNNDKTMYKILIPGEVKISSETISLSSSSGFPINSAGFDKDCYIITIKFGG